MKRFVWFDILWFNKCWHSSLWKNLKTVITRKIYNHGILYIYYLERFPCNFKTDCTLKKENASMTANISSQKIESIFTKQSTSVISNVSSSLSALANANQFPQTQIWSLSATHSLKPWHSLFPILTPSSAHRFGLWSFDAKGECLCQGMTVSLSFFALWLQSLLRLSLFVHISLHSKQKRFDLVWQCSEGCYRKQRGFGWN